MSTSNKKTRIWPAVVFTATFLVIVALITKLFLVPTVDVSLILTIAMLTGFLILSPRLFDIVELGLSKDSWFAKLNDMEKRVADAEVSVQEAEKKIDRIFAYTMSDSMFENLQKLASGHFGHFKVSAGLRRELTHLREIGYITVKGYISNLPDSGDDLSKFITVTPIGKEFIDLRKSLEKFKPA